MADVMLLADYLQFTTILDLCLEIIGQNRTPANLPLYIRYSKSENKSLVDDFPFVTHHYLEIIQHPDFVRNVIDVDELNLFLHTDFIMLIKREWHILVFQVLVRWLRFCEGREVHARDLLKIIHYEQISEEDIKNEVLPCVMEFPDCEDLVDMLKSYLEKPFEQPFISKRFSAIEDRLGGSKFNTCAVLYVFGIQDPSFKSGMMAFCFSDRRVYYWPLDSGCGILEPKGDCIGQYGFIVGGHTMVSETKEPSASFTRYNMNTGETLKLKDVPEPTFSHCAIIHHKECQLWVIGGVVKKRKTHRVTGSVNIYDIKANTWKDGPRLPEPLCDLAACYGTCIFNEQDGIFISGGTTKNIDKPYDRNASVRGNIYFISKDTACWEKVASLGTPRYGHVMYVEQMRFYKVPLKPHLYIIGGKSKQGKDVETVEKLTLGDKETRICDAPFLLGNCGNPLTKQFSEERFFSDDRTDGKSIVHCWGEWFHSSVPDVNGWVSWKLPFSLRGALILPCKQETDVRGPLVTRTKMEPFPDLGQQEEEDDDEEEDEPIPCTCQTCSADQE